MSLKQETVTGVAWLTLARFAQQTLRFALAVVLARLLLPEDFGLLGMVLFATGFAAVISELGLGAALVQRKEISRRHEDTIFWVTATLGVLLAISFAAAAPLLAQFYGYDEIVPLTRVLSLNFIFAGLAVAPKSLLKRGMKFQQLAAAETVAYLLSGALAIYCAISGWGVYSLAVQSVALTLFDCALVFRLASWHPGLLLSASALGDVLRFGLSLSGFGTVLYASRNLDDLLIGKVMGSDALGIYSRTYTLMLLPVRELSGSLAQVFFPALSSIQDDKQRVKRVYLQMVSVLAFATFPLCAGMLVTAEPLVLTLLGARWSGVIPVLQILSSVAILHSLIDPTGLLFVSQGRTDLMFRWGVVSSTIVVAAIACGVYLGSLEAVAWCYFLAHGLILYPSLRIPGRLIDMKAGEVMRTVSGTLGITLAMAAVVVLADRAIPAGLAPLPRLGVLVGVGAATYLGLAVGLRLTVVGQLKSLVAERIRRQPQS